MGTQQNQKSNDDLTDVARDEREFVKQNLEEKLGREPSEDEVNDWLREHTESY